MLFISFLLLPLQTKKSSACGGYLDEYAMFYTFFDPNIMNAYSKQDYSPFFLDPHYPDITPDDYKGQNIAEWKSFFDNLYSADNIEELVYRDSVTVIETALSQLSQGALKYFFKLPVESKSQSKKIFLALQYLKFAKQCEPIVISQNNEYWEPVEHDTVACRVAIKTGMKLRSAEKNNFLKLRYDFQIERLYFFNGSYQNAIDYFRKKIEPVKTNSSIRVRALGYEAGAYYKLHDYAHANYIYSLTYDQYPSNKNSAYWGFHPQDESDWQRSLALAKTPREKMVLWHLLGIYKDPLRAMKEIYSIDPVSDLLDLLLMRAIAIEEQYVISENKSVPGEYSFGYWAALDFDPDTSGNHLLAFVKACAEKSNTLHPALWNISSGYLLYLTGGDSKSAAPFFSAARKDPSVDSLSLKQIQLTELLFRIREIDHLDAETEEEILPMVKILKDLDFPKGHGGYSDYTPSASAWDYVHIELSEKYSQQHDFIRAELCNHNDGYFKDSVNTQWMLNFFRSTNKSAWDQYSLQYYFAKERDITEWQAINFMSHYNFDAAVKKLSEVPGTGDQPLYGDPFIIHIQDCHDCDHRASSYKNISIFDFAKEMRRLQQLTQTKPSDPNNYFKFANGIYNMTWFGNARHLYECTISSDLYYSWGIQTSGDENMDYLRNIENTEDCTQAKKYYQLALQHSKSKEFSAQCCWMIAKCELNETFEGEDFQAGDHMKMMKEKFSKTNYYQDVIRECGYFRTFLAINK
ncbi:MAG TPA: hypothetical protein VE978_16690 [Chitinophagales bacterium]|nr:hypothetical protein [Chitinophagales bacterium]